MPGQDGVVRVGLVGAGSMGSLHARVLSQHARTELAVVVDPDLGAARTVTEAWGGTAAAELDDPAAVDAVVLATPTENHHALGRRILEAGVPLLVEKPISVDIAEVRDLVELARTRGVPLTCGFVERFNPAVTMALGIVEEPLHVRAVRHSPYAGRIRTGAADDLAIHDIDLAIRVAGRPPTAVRATFGSFHPESAPGAEDVADFTLDFGGGVCATLTASRIAQRRERTLVIGGIDIQVEVDLLRQDVTVYRHVGNRMVENLAYRQQTIIDIPVFQARGEPLMAQLDNFVGLVGGTVDARAELEGILPAHDVIAAARAGASAGKP